MFGTTCGALFQIILYYKTIGRIRTKTGQRLWGLPLWDDWEDDIKSDVADFKNISLKPVGDCIVAATF